jgi:hypothetical protein
MPNTPSDPVGADREARKQSEGNMLSDNIVWGMRRGLAFAGVISLFVLVIYIANGAAFAKLGISLPEIVLLYAVGGTIAGAVVGAMRPLTNTRVGAMATGVAAALPVSLALGLAFYGAPTQWRRANVANCVIYAVIMGIMGGNVLWSQFVKRQ